MDPNELLIRTMNAAKAAREQGFEKTADAFDEIVESLLEFMNAQNQFSVEKRANSSADMLHFH